MNRMPSRWLALAGSALFAAACAQSNGDINRVQPNVVKKADLLDGQWYFRNTVTKTPATTGFTFTGETGNLEKLVWEIQEKTLIGYRAYPYIVGTDSKVDPTSIPSGTTTQVCDADGKCLGGQPYYGAPLVAYSIQSHFDIQRNYSTSTGEQGNIIQENSSDRPWNQREYLRVNWSANLLNKGDSMSWNTLQNPAGGTDFNAWIQANEPGSDRYDWPNFEYGSDGKLKYMDFTGRYMAQPTTVYIEGYGNYPMCFLRGGRYDCTAQEIHMRTSLSKVDPKVTNDYEPLVYGNELMAKFGFFRTERLNYDRKFGNTESARILLANRYRIFKSAFEKDGEGRPDQTKPIPLASREPKPIVYYVAPERRTGDRETYQTYLEAARTLELNWDRAFRRAAAAAQGVDPANFNTQMFYVCENPVPEGAPEACGPKGFEAKFGDLRHSFLYTITDPVPNGLLGYGPSSADPETGEIISANANTYSAAVEMLAQRTLDTMDLLVGERTIDNIIRGEDVISFMKANQSYASRASKQDQLQAELQGIPQKAVETTGAFQRPTAALAQKFQRLKVSGGLPAFGADQMKAAAEVLHHHPELESIILDNPEVQADLVGLLPEPMQAQALEDKDFARNASRSVLTRVTDSLAYQKARLEWASRRNMYLAEYLDRPLTSLALREHAKRQARRAQLVAEGKTSEEANRIANDEVRRRLRQAIWRATSEHEFGHTVGLRHNFQGSFDAINFFDKYWELRQSTLTVSQNNQQVVPRRPADLKAAADGTENQLAGGIRELEYSSIMDYGGKVNADMSGIGKYDEAAILFAYSGGREPGYVEVFESLRSTPQTFPGSDGNQLTLNGAAYDLALVNAEHQHPGVPNFTERYHYSTVPLRFGEGSNTQEVVSDGLDKLRQRKLMKWSEVKVEQERVRQLLKSNSAPSAQDLAGVPLEVPYMFCTDDHVGPVLSCRRFDRGPDYYEMAQTNIEDYWNGYFFTHFKRDRYVFSSSGALNNAYGTFLELGDIYKHWTHAMYGQQHPGQQNLGRYSYDPLMQDTWTMAVLDGLNANLAVLTVPPAGFFMHRNIPPAGRWDIVSEGVDFDELSPQGQQVIMEYYSNPNSWQYPATRFAIMKRGQARRMYSRYDFKSGFGFFDRMLEAGHYNDQMGAMFAAVEPASEFLGTDTYADINRYNIPYYLVFTDEMTDTFSSLWGGVREKVRPMMYLTKNDVGTVTSTPALHFQTFVPGQKYINGFEYPKRQDVICANGQTTDCVSAAQSPAPAEFQLTWTSRIYSLWLGMGLFKANYDLEFAKKNHVVKLGGSEQYQVPADHTSFEVADISTGARYVAAQPTSATDDYPAVRIIKIASAYRQVVEDPTMCPMPTLLDATGTQLSLGACMAADEVTNPALVEQRRREYLEYFKDQVRDLDLMRGFYNAFGRAF